MTNQEIKLEFKYTEAEYLSAARLLTFKDSDAIFRSLLAFAFILGGALVIAGLLTDIPWWVTFLLTSLLWIALYYNALVRLPRRNFRGDGKYRDQYQLMFSDEGIAAKTKSVEAKAAWSLYTKVIEGADLYLLVYGKDLRTMTVVPKRAFRDSLQENAFRELLTRHISSRSAAAKLKVEAADEYKPTSLNPPDWR